MRLVPPQTELLTAVLDISQAQHTVLAANIANANTPGYRRREVDFERSLVRLLEGNGPKRGGIVVREADEPPRLDGNNVDVDQELAAMFQNALLYQVTSQIVSVRFNLMRRALSGAA